MTYTKPIESPLRKLTRGQIQAIKDFTLFRNVYKKKLYHMHCSAVEGTGSQSANLLIQPPKLAGELTFRAHLARHGK